MKGPLLSRNSSLLVLWLSLLVGTLLVVPLATANEFPLASTGDIWFQVDHAGFLGDNGRVVEEYYFRVTNNQLEFIEEGDEFGGKIFVNLKFKDAEEKELGEAGKRFEFTVPSLEIAGSPDHAQILVIRESLDPRARSVEITIEDLNARKRGLLYMFTGKRKSGGTRGTLELPPFLDKDFGISDIQFAWEVREVEEDTSFEKHGLNVIPNPARTYGLLQPRLTAYYEVYDLRDLGDEPRDYLVHHELQDPIGNVTRSKPDTVRSATGEWIKVLSFDLSQVVTGTHILRAVIVHPETGEESVSEREFSLLWRNEFWEMTEQAILDEARVLFQEDEYERFKIMSSGDRAQYVEKFWANGDPSPGSARNELREEFLRRVAHANTMYTTHIKGMLTDRGRLLIRFGEPDEIHQELMPTQDRQLDNLVPQLSAQNPEGRKLATSDIVDTRPYEIWSYTRQGSPLFPEREIGTTVTGLLFVFVDETGTGDYILRYSSDFIGY
jgi:GWxTD domain-containing protein